MAVDVDPPPSRTDVEPDYRFTLANERTFLAWTRTSLAMLAGGVAVVQLVPDLADRPARLTLGLILVGLAFVIAVGGYLRWRRVQRAMRFGLPLPRPLLPAVIAGGLGLVVAVTVLLLITT
jgi:putative membrane protein